MKRPLAILLALGAMVATTSAAAQTPADKTTADALFEQGKKLMVDGAYAQACPKFAESQRLDAGIGTMLRLADCYEKNGQTASAWAQFREAAQVAGRASDSRESVARRHAAELEPNLPKLAIALAPQAQVPGLLIKRDGETVGTATFGIEIPVDPGPHTVIASAPGRTPWTATVFIAVTGGSKTLTIPVLAEASPAPPALPVPSPSGAAAPRPVEGTEPHADFKQESPETAGPGASQKTLALVTGGVGVVAVGIGVVFGLNAKSNLNASNADNHCQPNNHCDQTGFDLRNSYKSAATASTVAFVVGGAALAGGAVLWLTAPKSGAQVALTPAIGARDAGFVLHGLW